MTDKYPDELRALVSEALRRYLPKTGDIMAPVAEAMAYSLLAPGKRFRPVLTLLSAEAVGADPKTVLPFACAIEFIHAYSLIHDDLPALDNDSLRRGKPTCHVKFGEDIAILAGDALFAEAFVLVLTEQPKYSDPGRLVDALKTLALATGIRGMVGGQVVDIIATGKPIDAQTLEFIHNHKTGSLITAAARCGAALGGGNQGQIEAITVYAGHLGLAFQIIDDILDVIGNEALVGKHTGRDFDNQKATFPSKLGVNRSKEEAILLINKAIEALRGADVKGDRLIDLANFVVGRKI